MSKVRINDLAREMEVKSKQILDVLGDLGLGEGKTDSSSIEDYEAEKVRGHIQRGGGPGRASAASRAPQGIQPKVDLSHISKPGDALKAILAKKQEQEDAARRSHVPGRPAPPAQPQAPAKPAPPTVVAAPPAAASRPEPRKIVPPVRQEPRIIPPAQPAIASRPPAKPAVAKAPPRGATAPPPAVPSSPPAVSL